MSEKYLGCVSNALDNVKKVIDALGDRYTVIVTADHGGHDRAHGTDMPEDVTIPMFFFGKQFAAAKQLSGVTILDIAPTVAKILGVPKAPEWEGKELI